MTFAPARIQTLAFLTCVAPGVARNAAGQAFNIDLGPGSVLPAPSDAYGAATGQTGHWDRATAGPYADLSDLTGAKTSAQFGGAAIGTSINGIPGSSPDENAMMQSVLALGGASDAVGVRRLEPGWYDVYVYCWAGPGGVQPSIDIASATSFYTFTPNSFAPWPGEQTLGITYVKARVLVDGPSAGIGITYHVPTNSFGVMNGIQLIPAPSPGVGITMVSFGISAAFRRRR